MKNKLIKIGLKLLIILIIILLYGRYIGTKGLKVKEYKITNEHFVENFYGLKIVHLSDIHYGSTVDTKDFEKIVKKINYINPDIVFITGDFYDKKISDEQINEFNNHLKNINAKIGKYFVIGNHDEMEKINIIVKDTNFIDLDNNYIEIYNSNKEKIFIAGIDTENIDESKIKSYLKDNSQNIVYKILLLHKPDFITHVDYNNYNLILAGHSHGGQVRLPFIGSIFNADGAKKYNDEHYIVNNSDLYISSGIGTSNLKFRLFNRPSISFYRLSNK